MSSHDPHQVATAKEQDEQAAFDSLRKILLAGEIDRLDTVEQRVEENKLDAEQLSELLPKAVSKATGRDEKLSRALAPTLTESFKSSIKDNPQSLVDVIFPIIGPAIRRSISEAIAGLVQRLNQTVEYSLSAKAWKWRWESIRTGRPFAEIVMLRTLDYRVERVFLIHRPDGLLLQHVAVTDAAPVETDLVSGMLTAIRDFVRDSFETSDQGGLKQLEVDDRTIWVERGPAANLAAVIQGHPPLKLRALLQQTLEEIHSSFHQELATFQGDSSSLAPVCPALERCLVSAQREQSTSQQSTWRRRLIGVGLLAGVLALLGFTVWGWSHYRHRVRLETVRRWLRAPQDVNLQLSQGRLTADGMAPDAWLTFAREQVGFCPGVRSHDLSGVKNRDQAWLDYLDRLSSQPGVAVTKSQIADEGYIVEGLRDPLAADPEQLLAEFGLTSESVSGSWRLVQSWEPSLIQKRVMSLLVPPEGVQSEWRGDSLVLRGTADHVWLQNAKQRVASLSEPITVDFSEVRNTDREALVQLKAKVESAEIRFLIGETRLEQTQPDPLEEIASQIHDISELAAKLRTSVRITIVGSAGQAEAEDDQLKVLAISRARAIGYYLVDRGVPRDVVVVTTRTAGSTDRPGSRIRVRIGGRGM